jgi:hypothetical protein
MDHMMLWHNWILGGPCGDLGIWLFDMSTISLCFELDFMVWLLGSQNAAIVIVVVTTCNKTLTTSNY